MTRAGLTTERLARGAAALADEVGLENVTVSAVARRFGVKVASLYSHIRNAQDLKVQVALLALAELADEAIEALAGRSGKQALIAYANAYRTYAKKHPGRYAAAQLRLDQKTLLGSAAGRHSEMTRAILFGYELSEDEHLHAVRLLHSTFHGYVSLEQSGGFDYSGDVEISWIIILEILDKTLRRWATTWA
jgi:AcrR family transcriptional regulator